MSLSTVLFLFLAHLGVGIAFTLLLVSSEAGIKFFRFNAGLASILLIVALAFHFSASSSLDAGEGSGALTFSVALDSIALVISTALTVLYWATVGRILTKIRTSVLAGAVLTGTAAIVLQALDLSVGWTMPL